MSRHSECHEKVDAEGRGKCGVPMWCGGMDAGFCNREAFGPQTPRDTFIDKDGIRMRYGGGRAYPNMLCCPDHGGPATRVFMDGNAWCAVHPDFVNLQESDAGFGDSPEAARAALSSRPLAPAEVSRG